MFVCISLLKKLEKQQNLSLVRSSKHLCIKSQILDVKALEDALLVVLAAVLLIALLVVLAAVLLIALLVVLAVITTVNAVHLAAHIHGLINHWAAALKDMAVVAK
ncbi:hypothetical protein ABW04_07200 [Priestia megaterium]|nr:hypothetical protein ABW04_07200 [Priestia megaterium]